MTLDLRTAQRRLTLLADGILGPKTWGALFAQQGAPPDLAGALGAAMASHGADINTPLEVVHFLAQAGHETAGFRYLVELGGPTYCSRYDGRADLGNCDAGDGYRFRGRGIFQLTGRTNYAEMGRKLGADLVGLPNLAATPDLAIRTALEFWRSRGLAALAAADQVEAITRRINGGTNGLADRQDRLAKLKALFSATGA